MLCVIRWYEGKTTSFSPFFPDLDLQCPPGTCVNGFITAAWDYWDVVETLGGGSWWKVTGSVP